MKRTFSKDFGRVTEDLELGLEENLIYVHYKKGDYEKSACILKNENKPLEEYLTSFLIENNVSDDLKTDVTQFLKTAKDLTGHHWNEFTNFLMKALSLHMVFALAIGISVFLGYKAGSLADGYLGLYPVFTLIGLAGGLALGGFAAYSMAIKYFRPAKAHPEARSVNAKQKQAASVQEWPQIEVTVDEVRNAVRKYSEDLPKGVYRTILVNDDNSIDFVQLAPILGGIPDKKFYMSRETYDLFEESEKEIPVEMDRVQRAVDQYVKDHREYPMLKFDPSRRVNYYQLLEEHYLKERPEIQFYITDCDGLVSQNKPPQKHP